MSEKTIFLVDDDPEIVKTLRSYLQQAGYAVLVAYNGKDALSIVRAQAVDCMVLDVMLPDFDGWQIMQRIRANRRTADIVSKWWMMARAFQRSICPIFLTASTVLTAPVPARQAVQDSDWPLPAP